MSTETAPSKSATVVAARKRRWSPRMWIGMAFPSWVKLLVRNRFAISPRYWHKGVAITLVAIFNSLMWSVEQAIYGRKIRRTKVDPRPLIILGHWRTGTTWLHELLGLDPQFTSPSTYQAMAPNHFLVTKWWITRLFFWLLPDRRPMDNMPLGWDRPQEDEFALCNLGIPSPYLTIAFPNHPPVFSEYLTLDVPPEAADRWRRTLYYFLQKVTVSHAKRIILKSPPHTARVRTLLEMFPEARFVYLVRDPQAVFPSTMNLWQRLNETHGLQVPNSTGLQEYVLTTFNRLHERFERDRSLIPDGRLYELRYEDLVQNPLGRLREIYQRLELGDFDAVQPLVEQYLVGNADYQTNQYTSTPEERDLVARRWQDYARQHGYA